MSATENISFQKLVNATVSADNSSDTTRNYDITANVVIQGENAERIENGQVKKTDDGVYVASFSDSYGSFNINYQNVPLVADRVAVLTAISAFIASAKAKVANNDVVSI